MGECDCRVDYNMDNLYKNLIDNKEYIKFINSKSKINSFLNLKCAKESFNYKNLKNNTNFIVSIIFISLYIILLIIYIISFKEFLLQENKEIKSNPPPKIEKFQISNDLDDEEEEEKEEEKKDERKDERKDEKIEEKIEEKLKIQTKNIYKKNNENESKESNYVFLDDVIKKTNRKYRHSISNRKNNKSKFILDSKNINIEKITNYKIEEENINIKGKNKKAEEKHIETEEKNIETEENVIKFSNTNSKNNIIISIKKEYFIIDKNKGFLFYYWKLITLKQPIINLFTNIKCLKSGESYLPLLVKILRLIFYLLLNIFFNSFHLDQKYFKNKFEYFNKKYNIINEVTNISLNERFSYSFSHTIKSGIICFIICLIIQSVLNYFFFNSKNKFVELKNDSNNNKNIIILLNKYYRKYYLIIFTMNLLIIIFIFYTIINFTQVYIGGFPDILAAMIWTFIFSQIFPFIYCIIFAFIIKKGMNDNNHHLIKIYKLIYF